MSLEPEFAMVHAGIVVGRVGIKSVVVDKSRSNLISTTAPHRQRPTTYPQLVSTTGNTVLALVSNSTFLSRWRVRITLVCPRLTP